MNTTQLTTKEARAIEQNISGSKNDQASSAAKKTRDFDMNGVPGRLNRGVAQSTSSNTGAAGNGSAVAYGGRASTQTMQDSRQGLSAHQPETAASGAGGGRAETQTDGANTGSQQA